MTYEMYQYVFLSGAIAAGIMLVVSILLFFTLKIPKVIGDLTGRTARKAIDNIRRQNEESGNKTYKSSVVNMQRVKMKDKISKSGRLTHREGLPIGTKVITEKISTQRLSDDQPASETTVLVTSDETTVLDSSYSETTVLQPVVKDRLENKMQQFGIECEITFIHTNEVIA